MLTNQKPFFLWNQRANLFYPAIILCNLSCEKRLALLTTPKYTRVLPQIFYLSYVPSHRLQQQYLRTLSICEKNVLISLLTPFVCCRFPGHTTGEVPKYAVGTKPLPKTTPYLAQNLKTPILLPVLVLSVLFPAHLSYLPKP